MSIIFDKSFTAFMTVFTLFYLSYGNSHIPNKDENTIRYYGFHLNKARGLRAKFANSANFEVEIADKNTIERKVVRSRWAAMIQKVYEIDPLVSPKCGELMHIIAMI